MQRAAVLLSALGVLLTFADVSAQARPDFSGSWALIAPAGGAAPAGGGGGGGARGGGGGGGGAPGAGAPAGAPGGGGGAARGGGGGGGRGGGGFGGAGLGMAATIAMTATDLTVTRQQGANEVKMVYKLDGSESSNTIMAGGNEVTQTSKASFAGNVLTIVTQGQNGETTAKYSLNAQGQLVVETTAPGRGGGAPTTTTQTYQKGN